MNQKNEEIFNFTGIKGIKYIPKPVIVPPSLRSIWRISQILMILKYNCSGNKASLAKIHFMLSFIDNGKIHDLSTLNSDKKKMLKLSVKFNPYINKACFFGISKGFLEWNGENGVKLTKLGVRYIEYIDTLSLFLNEEMEPLKKLKKNKISEKLIQEILR